MAERTPPNTGTRYGEGTINGREAYQPEVEATDPEFVRRNDINRGLLYSEIDPEQIRLAKISHSLNAKFRKRRVLGAHPEGLDDD